jgi:gentisate 1,2-dioxygenase
MQELSRIESMDGLREALRQRHMVPGWEKLPRPIFTHEMRSEFDPGHWRYAEVRAAMQSAGRLIGTDLAERRNTIMVNPRPGHDIETLDTLICAYQSILPGEKARSHRHASHAMRVIIESKGSYSVVNGHKHPMETGDIVLTPGGSWHGHGHEGSEQAYWFDCLDIPLTRRLETVFFEEHPDEFEKITNNSPESRYRYPWASTLEKLRRATKDEHVGETIELEAVDMPTITIKVHRWPKGWSNRPFRHTANALHVVLQGHGQTTVGERSIAWEHGDTVALPAWQRLEHHASADSVVVALTDENLQRWTRFYRREALS